VLIRSRLQKEAMMRAQSAFGGGEDPQMQWALAESQVTHEPLKRGRSDVRCADDRSQVKTE
jgi:hypothetical protein